MTWWRRIDEAEWPDGEPWPAGEPRPNLRSWRRGLALVACAALTVLIALALGELGLPSWIALLAVLLVGLSPICLSVVRSVFKEARRQGWGRNVYGD